MAGLRACTTMTTHKPLFPRSSSRHRQTPGRAADVHHPPLCLTAMETTETASRTLLTLPGEIQNKIIGELEPIDIPLLRATCRYFRKIIPPRSMRELLVAESSSTGMERDLYACCLCLRLRHSSHFADKMMKRHKRKLAAGSSTRFCMECGLNPAPGQHGYCPGSHITKNGVVSVICISCRRLWRPSRNGYVPGRYCTECLVSDAGAPRPYAKARIQQSLWQQWD
ncbi:hypothetical protein VTK56DRAFT_4534 [Thermocarpiscus australiensis]